MGLNSEKLLHRRAKASQKEPYLIDLDPSPALRALMLLRDSAVGLAGGGLEGSLAAAGYAMSPNTNDSNR